MITDQQSALEKSGAAGERQANVCSTTAKSAGNPPRLSLVSGPTDNASPNMRFMPAMLEQFVEADEAALFVHTSARHLQQLAREGKVPAHPRGDGQRKRWLFLLSELDAWLRARVNSPCDPCRASRSN